MSKEDLKKKVREIHEKHPNITLEQFKKILAISLGEVLHKKTKK
jgi:uncharacterized protein (UPF0303 family)